MIRPKLKLIGEDGNAYMILAKARRAAKQAGWTMEQLQVFMDEAISGDYDHLLMVVQQHFDVE